MKSGNRTGGRTLFREAPRRVIRIMADADAHPNESEVHSPHSHRASGVLRCRDGPWGAGRQAACPKADAGGGGASAGLRGLPRLACRLSRGGGGKQDVRPLSLPVLDSQMDRPAVCLKLCRSFFDSLHLCVLVVGGQGQIVLHCVAGDQKICLVDSEFLAGHLVS